MAHLTKQESRDYKGKGDVDGDGRGGVGFPAAFPSPPSSSPPLKAELTFLGLLVSLVTRNRFPFLETSVRYLLWLSSSFTDQPGELPFNFAIFRDIEQMMQHPTNYLVQHW
ncbi:hypothetical protein E2C01_011409 [Portunus trituberculatus]|uniref:Uncharacterized protein n=1 Tax=Portunus trituberculatus TaxID=210409 RepID=A0A5B7DBB1_PORTR|nr:hypothetical protein [Portunus trituberculatus]